MKRKKKLIFMHLLIVFGCVLILVLFDFRCVFRSLTGVPCPGCGMSRSVLALLRLDFAKSFYYHPLGMVILPLLFYIFHAEKLFKASPKMVVAVEIITALLLFVTYIIRLLMHAIP